MTNRTPTPHKTPVIMLDPSSGDAYRIFNPNEWDGLSKTIVSSCAAQLGLVHYSCLKLRAQFDHSEKLCTTKIDELKKQWEAATWDIEAMVYFAEIPEVHLFIQAYLNSVKSFFDLLVQLVSTERIVNKKLHGFHKKGQDPGGNTLYILKNRPINRSIAGKIYNLFITQKKLWIDTVVNARDSLVHPERGIVQIMFQLKFISGKSGLKLQEILKPTINDISFDQYSVETYKRLITFAETFMKILKNSLHGA
jgi:hypothetical protein